MAGLIEDGVRQLLRSIAAGEMPPGGRLPREVDLARDLNVSRTTVRSILQGLVDRGVIAVKHGSGQTVRPPEDWNVLDLDVLGAVIEVGDVRALVKEVIEARTVIEVPAAGLAAERATTAEVVGMREHVNAMRTAARSRSRAAGGGGFEEAERAFHRALGAATRNRPLAGTLDVLHQATQLADVGRGRRLETAGEREVLIDALNSGDADAAREAAAHHLAQLDEAVDRRRSPRRR